MEYIKTRRQLVDGGCTGFAGELIEADVPVASSLWAKDGALTAMIPVSYKDPDSCSCCHYVASSCSIGGFWVGLLLVQV